MPAEVDINLVPRSKPQNNSLERTSPAIMTGLALHRPVASGCIQHFGVAGRSGMTVSRLLTEDLLKANPHGPDF